MEVPQPLPMFSMFAPCPLFYIITYNFVVVKTGFEPVGNYHIRFDLLLRLRNLKEELPIPPLDYMQLWLMRPHEVCCPPSSVFISDPLNFKNALVFRPRVCRHLYG